MKEKGMTLIEILLVVLIIGILSSIAVPNFIAARKKAQAKTCIQNMKEIEATTERWAIDFNKNNGDTLTWQEIVPTYLRTQPTCPAGGTYKTSQADSGQFIVGDTVTCSIGINNPLIGWDDHILP